MQWISLAVYRIWRLRRVLALELLAPWAAIWLAGRWDPAFALMLPMLLENGAVLNYSAYVLAAAVLFPTGAMGGLVLAGAFSLVILVMPAVWSATRPGGPVEGGFFVSVVIATILAWGLARITIRLLDRVAWPGERLGTATIRIARPADEVYEALRLGESDAPLNEVILRIVADEDRPGRLHSHYHGGAELATDIVHQGGLKQTTVTELDGMREVYNLEVAPEGEGAVLREASRTTGFHLPLAVGYWLKDFLADRQIYFRDRLEGRDSLAVHATLARALRRPGLLQRLLGRRHG